MSSDRPSGLERVVCRRSRENLPGPSDGEPIGSKFREGTALFPIELDGWVAPETGRGEQALRDLPGEGPAVALVDIGLPGMSGIECASELRRRLPGLLILMLTEHDDAARLFGALRAGAHGYLLKSTAPTELLDQIALLRSGGSPMSPEIARKIVGHFHGTAGPVPATATGEVPKTDQLTSREWDVARAITDGARVKEVANDLGISVSTVQG